MTVSSYIERVATYTGDNTTLIWTIPFRVDTQEEVRAVVYDGNGVVVDNWTYEDGDFEVSGLGDVNSSMTCIAVVGSGNYMKVYTDIDKTQELPLGNLDAYKEKDKEAAFDKLTLIIHEIIEILSRCYVKDIYDTSATARASIEAYVAAAAASALASATSETNAETAETNAETARTGAETAETNAEAAQIAAAAAQSAAETAQTGAETAQTAAEAAQTSAETAQSAAETAQSNAETAETNAETARTGAETAETNAEAAQTAAESAQSAAESAQTAAEAAETGAEAAQTAAEAAQSAAEAAQSAAETAQTGAETAETNTEALLAAAAGFQFAITEVNQGIAYSVLVADRTIICTPTANHNINLLAIASYVSAVTGQRIVIKNASASYYLTIVPDGSETIDGASSWDLGPKDWIELMIPKSGTDWYKFGGSTYRDLTTDDEYSAYVNNTAWTLVQVNE